MQVKFKILCPYSQRFVGSFFLVYLSFFVPAIALGSPELKGIERYKIETTADISSHVEGQEGDQVFRIGSGLAYKKRTRSQATLFYTVSDRPVYDEKGTSYPFIAVLNLSSQGVVLESLLPTLVEKSQGLRESLTKHPLDIEGVAVAPSGYLWLADEALPSILKVHAKSGLILERIEPGKGLPRDLAKRQENRGLEGISVFPNGDLLLAMQSVLKNPEETGRYIRMLRFDPKEKTNTVFQYPIDAEQYADILDVKIGDVQVIDESRLLALEHGPSTEEGKSIARVYLVSLPSDGSKLLIKELFLDLTQNGWSYEKPEGITIFDGGYALGITNDPSEGEAEVLWVVNLAKSLTPWRWSEWFLVGFLIFIVVAFTVFSVMILVTSGESQHAESRS